MSAREETPELRRVEELFHAAADLEPEARGAFLAERCRGDARLRARLEALLAAAAEDVTLAPAFPGAPDPAGEGPGSRVGRYKLLQQIGEGGFGVVYMAEQTEPVRRKVALKIIRLGMDSREVVARFEAERQALAIMDHPNIARVLDGGATESGRPYFVMELVRGVSITDYCDQNQLSTRERLELFVPVCQAVQHAHQKGVIHRDLKPSNVMVTLHDGRPVPKVIDFGVAKAMHSPLTEKTLFTAFGRFIGTPAYMSPEQAEFSALDVDTRSDIYSLGVLLYELLTGTTPFDPRRLLEEGLVAIQRTIREEQPQRPSIRISTSGDAAIASKRRTDPPALSKRLRGDLDWIVMKCLEKERVRRYGTASEIGADIARHLRDEPVLAGPPSATYRLRKLLARNRVAVATGAVVLFALVGGIVGTSAGMIAASRQRDEAVRARARAEEEAARTSAVTDFLIDTLALTDPVVSLDADPSVSSLLVKASNEVDEAFHGQPENEARVRMTIGHAFRALGENELAEHHLGEGVRLAEGEDDFDAVALYDALWALTHVLFTLDRPDAMNVAQRARRVAHDHIAEEHPELADSLERLTAGVIDAAFARDEEAARELPALLAETVERSESALPHGDPLWPIVADTWIAAGYTVWYTAIDPLTEDFFGRAAEVLRRELPPSHTKRAEAVGLLVDSLNRLGKADEAEAEMRATVAEMRKILPAETPQLALAESMLGESLAAQGKYAEAEDILVRAHEVFTASVGDNEKFLVAESFRRVLTMYVGWGREEEAARYREELQEMCVGGEFLLPWAIVRLAFPGELAELARLGDELDRLCGTAYYTTRQVAIPGVEAAARLGRLLRLRDERLPDDHPLSLVLARELLAWTKTLDRTGVEDVLEDVVAESLALLSDRAELFPHEVADGRILLAEMLWDRGEHDAARALAREGVPAYDGAARRWDLAIAMVRGGRSLLRMGLLREAEQLLLPAYESIVAHFGPANADARTAAVLLHELYQTWNRPEAARRFPLNPDARQETIR